MCLKRRKENEITWHVIYSTRISDPFDKEGRCIWFAWCINIMIMVGEDCIESWYLENLTNSFAKTRINFSDVLVVEEKYTSWLNWFMFCSFVTVITNSPYWIFSSAVKTARVALSWLTNALLTWKQSLLNLFFYFQNC